jgi:hypothetical protein
MPNTLHANFSPSLRPDSLRVAQGLIAETYPRLIGSGPFAGATGTLYFAQVYLARGDILTNCHIIVGIAGVAETFARVGLWDSVTGALLASCVDQGAGWATVGLHSQAFSAPFTVQTSGIYYLGYLVLAGTVPGLAITLAPLANRIGLTSGIAGGPLLFGSTVGLLDLPNPLVIAAGTAPGVYWIGLS